MRFLSPFSDKREGICRIHYLETVITSKGIRRVAFVVIVDLGFVYDAGGKKVLRAIYLGARLMDASQRMPSKMDSKRDGVL